MRGDRGTDIRPHDNAHRLRKRHQSGRDKTDNHHRGYRRRLDDGCDDRAGTHTLILTHPPQNLRRELEFKIEAGAPQLIDFAGPQDDNSGTSVEMMLAENEMPGTVAKMTADQNPIAAS